MRLVPGDDGDPGASVTAIVDSSGRDRPPGFGRTILGERPRTMAELSEIERIVGEAEQAAAAGDNAAAERALRRVLKLQEAGLGLSHPDVANTLNDLAVVCNRLGRPDEAEFLYRRALGIARRTLAPDHPYIAVSLANLSNLYRAQGKPEKLEKIREGPGSRLPEVEVADETGDDAGEVTARPETPAAPVPAVPSERPQGDRPHPLYAAAAHPAVLMVGAGVVLVSTLWLLFGGSANNADNDLAVAGPDGAGRRLEASGGELSDGAVDAADGPVSSEGETAPTPDRTATAPEPGTASVPTPSPEDGVSSTSVASSDVPPAPVSDESPEPTARPDPSPPSAIATSSVVTAAEICSQLETRTTDGAPLAEWQCQRVVDRATPGQLFFYTRIRSRTSTAVQHR